jgi:hypothetical protein
VGDQQLIIDRALVDKNGNQLGSFVLHAPADVVCHRARLPTTGSPTLSSSGRLLITERRVFWMLRPAPERPKSPLIDTLHQEQLPAKDA